MIELALNLGKYEISDIINVFKVSFYKTEY